MLVPGDQIFQSLICLDQGSSHENELVNLVCLTVLFLVIKLNILSISHSKNSWVKTDSDKHFCRLGYKM